jgi:hypothetical protein
MKTTRRKPPRHIFVCESFPIRSAPTRKESRSVPGDVVSFNDSSANMAGKMVTGRSEAGHKCVGIPSR